MTNHEGVRSTWRLRLLGFAAMAGLLVGPAYAQSTTGSIFGTVTDQSGGVIPSSTVTATDLKTGILRTAQTNASGNYVFPSLPPGDYAISASATSFAKQTKSGVHVDVNQSAEASFQMSVGNAAETVTVSGGGQLIEMRESQIGETVDQKRIEDLPLNGRDVSSLVQLVPGVTDYGAQNAGGNQFGTPSTVRSSSQA
jgi:hypothetical protein